MHVLENDFVKVSFVKKGAELVSFIQKETGREWMWSADPAFWPKTSPILFPIIGKLVGNTYTYKGTTYQLPKHGFARDLNFELKEQTDDKVHFQLISDQNTLKCYPFNFILGVTYYIEGPSLTCSYSVVNSGLEPMLFSLGGHPAFAIGSAEVPYNQYELIFPQDEQLNVFEVSEAGLIKNNCKILQLKEGRLQLSHKLFYNDALVLSDLKSKHIYLSADNNRFRLSFEFNGFSFFGIWAAKDANFICLEPWCGVGDFEHHDQSLNHKAGIEQLISGETFERRWTARII